MLMLAVLGPGFVTASAGNDVGGIATYSLAGAQFGYKILWILLPLAISLIVVQEMAARMGTVTGKGLASLIRENFGVRISFFAMVGLFLINLFITASEFAGIATAAEIFHVSRFIVVPLSVVAVFLFILRFNNKVVERTFVVFSLIYLSYIVSAVLAHPDWHAVITQTVVPTTTHSSEYVVMIVGLIGTTITPWMQFYLQASIVEKGITERQYGMSRWDVILGCFVTDIVAFFIVVACGATLYVGGTHDIADAADAAVALKPFAGQFASLLFAAGLVNAAFLSAAILPLATTYNICEGLGVESGINKRFSEAPIFYWLYTALIVLGAGIVLIPHLPLMRLILVSQVANGVLLPFVLFYMLTLVNREDLMGRHRNSRFANAVAVTTSVVMVALTLVMLWTAVTGQ